MNQKMKIELASNLEKIIDALENETHTDDRVHNQYFEQIVATLKSQQSKILDAEINIKVKKLAFKNLMNHKTIEENNLSEEMRKQAMQVFAENMSAISFILTRGKA